MGMSASAKLVYGFVLGEDALEDIDQYEISNKWRDLFIGEFPKNGTEEEQDSWREKIKEYEKSSDYVDIVSGGYEFETNFIETSLEVSASDYGHEKVDIKKLASIDTSVYDLSIKKFCEKYGIEYEQPYWFIMASYG